MRRAPLTTKILLGLFSCAVWSSEAGAHLELTNPPPREGGRTGALKSKPCGQSQNARTETVTEFSPGETITVEWDEFIHHPSYYRIAFDVDGDDDFTIRDDMDSIDPNTDDPELLEPIGDVVLAYVEDEPGAATYSVEVTLPNVTCETCTLQVIQFMYDKVNNNVDDEYYFQCADLALRGEVLGTGGSGSGTGGAPTGAGGEAAGGASAAGGTPAGGGAASDGGAFSGGASVGGFSVGGSTSAGGLTSAGGETASGGVVAAGGFFESVGGSAASGPVEPTDEMGGCSVASGASRSGALGGLFFVLGAAVLGRRRRRSAC